MKMEKWFHVALVVICILIAVPALATNGDSLISVGPISRSMGGVGVAAPQDSVSAVFDNPAALWFLPCGSGSESVFAGTVFDSTVKADITVPGPSGPVRYTGESQQKSFTIPAIAITSPITDRVRFAVGAYGVSGMGVDYRNNGWDFDGNPNNGFEGDAYINLEIMRFASSLAFKVNENFSVGASLHVVYGNLDMGRGGADDYALGLQLGALYRVGMVRVGATYITPEKNVFERVANFDAFMGSTSLDTLNLESPACLATGVAVSPGDNLLVEADLRWYNWGGAEGYKDFDWKDQWIYSIGIQYKPTAKLALRAGFNYGQSPVRVHNGWDPMGVTEVQGKSTPTFGYEYLRVVGFPAVAESHLTAGAGWQLSNGLTLNLSYAHAFDKSIRETSAFGAVHLESSLSEDSIGFGFNWKF